MNLGVGVLAERECSLGLRGSGNKIIPVGLKYLIIEIGLVLTGNKPMLKSSRNEV